jgi:long-subunit acyl-CoA synthetase (AMP-forming)
MFYSGGRVGIYNGDFKDLSRDLPILQPTIMICVPRILNRIYNRVNLMFNQIKILSMYICGHFICINILGYFESERELGSFKSSGYRSQIKKYRCRKVFHLFISQNTYLEFT